MIAGVNTALLSKQALFGCSILGCCCKQVDNPGGRQFPPDRPTDRPVVPNPLVNFTTVPTTSQEVSTPSIETQIPLSKHRISKRAILRPVDTVARRLRSGMAGRSPDKVLAPRAINIALRDAFQQYLLWEEDEFLALILAADDEGCCYECPD